MKFQYKILRVDLTHGRIKSEAVKRGWGRRFIGGKGLGAAYLFDELKKGIDPLSPKNKLMFFIGPITGIAPGTSRYVVITKSPLTGTFLDSYAGGHFPAELRFGMPEHLGIIFEGRADGLVYLKVDHGDVEIVNAVHLKGKTTTEVKDSFPDFKVVSIGIAGENLVRFACITNDFGRNAGRGGAGAVMGSKNLKAVVVRGEKDTRFSKRITELRKRHQKRLLKFHEVYKLGTSSILELCNDAGILPTQNWNYGTFKHAEKISAKAVEENLVSRGACYFCPVACQMLTKANKGLFKGVYINGP